jgi:hypothetical protein
MPGGAVRLFCAELLNGLFRLTLPILAWQIVAVLAYFVLLSIGVNKGLSGWLGFAIGLASAFSGVPILLDAIEGAPSIKGLLDDLKRITPPRSGIPVPTEFKG